MGKIQRAFPPLKFFDYFKREKKNSLTRRKIIHTTYQGHPWVQPACVLSVPVRTDSHSTFFFLSPQYFRIANVPVRLANIDVSRSILANMSAPKQILPIMGSTGSILANIGVYKAIMGNVSALQKDNIGQYACT